MTARPEGTRVQAPGWHGVQTHATQEQPKGSTIMLDIFVTLINAVLAGGADILSVIGDVFTSSSTAAPAPTPDVTL